MKARKKMIAYIPSGSAASDKKRWFLLF